MKCVIHFTGVSDAVVINVPYIITHGQNLHDAVQI